MRRCVQKEDCPRSLEIEDSCLLQNPLAVSKIIRIKGQELFAKSIQLFLTDGYKVNELLITWQDGVSLVLKENFHLCAIRYSEVVVSKANNAFELDEEQWTANFIIMVGVLNLLVDDLLKIFEKK